MLNLINLINSLIPVACLVCGFFIGYKINGNTIKQPKTLNPIKIIKEVKEEHEEKKKAEEEAEYWADVFENLENYDGTAKSQKEVKVIDI